MKQLRITYTILLVFLLASCASYNKIEFEVLLPSKYSFTEPVSQLAVLNNASEQASTVGHTNYKKTINYKPQNKRHKTGSIALQIDSASSTCLYNVYNYLSETQMYEHIYFSKEKAYPKVNSYSSRNYFDTYGADALLVLEQLNYQDNFTINKNVIYNTKSYELEVIVKSSWSIYFSQTPSQAYAFHVSDTLYWNTPNIDRSECIYHTIWENGAKAAKMISPQWQKTSRLYYAGASYIYKQIDQALANNDWTQAATYWKQIYDGQKKNRKTKARMAYNMALYFEFKNDFESALSWIIEANTLFSEQEALYEVQMCMEYTKILQARQVNKKRIDQQWGL